ncbi:hypothetical protein F5887DRAFT_1081830 [Amanita rubescens]|nr:hypothetical protein F5887DRAFT_1081830 [Amanita rubescens]
MDFDYEAGILATANHTTLMNVNNAAYITSQNQNEELRHRIEMLEKELLESKTKLSTTEAFLERVLTNQAAPTPGAGTPPSSTTTQAPHHASFLLSTPAAPTPLNRDDYKQVKYWFQSSYQAPKSSGETDGMAIGRPRPGRPRGDSSEETPHTYLEDENGNTIMKQRVTTMGYKARRLWVTFAEQGMAPSRWEARNSRVEEYYYNVMANNFIEFRLCAGSWKLDLWTSKNYPSWVTNNVDKYECLKTSTKKRKNPSDGSNSTKRQRGGSSTTPSPSEASTSPVDPPASASPFGGTASSSPQDLFNPLGLNGDIFDELDQRMPSNQNGEPGGDDTGTGPGTTSRESSSPTTSTDRTGTSSNPDSVTESNSAPANSTGVLTNSSPPKPISSDPTNSTDARASSIPPESSAGTNSAPINSPGAGTGSIPPESGTGTAGNANSLGAGTSSITPESGMGTNSTNPTGASAVTDYFCTPELGSSTNSAPATSTGAGTSAI